MAPLSVTLSDL